MDVIDPRPSLVSVSDAKCTLARFQATAEFQSHKINTFALSLSCRNAVETYQRFSVWKTPNVLLSEIQFLNCFCSNNASNLDRLMSKQSFVTTNVDKPRIAGDCVILRWLCCFWQQSIPQ
jgi:hypothetical protein